MSLSAIAMANVVPGDSQANTTSSPPSLCLEAEGCLFVTAAGEFQAWHLVLIIAVVISVVAAIVCKVIPCKRWPPMKRSARLTSPTNQLVSEAAETTANPTTELEMQAYLSQPQPMEGLGAGLMLHPQDLPLGCTSPAVSGAPYGRYYPAAGDPYSSTMQVSMQDQLVFAERSVDGPGGGSVLMMGGEEAMLRPPALAPAREERSTGPASPAQHELLLAESYVLPTSQPSYTEYAAMIEDDAALEEDGHPRKSSFRKDNKKRHSYHFEKPHVSFRLASGSAQARSMVDTAGGGRRRSTQFEDSSDPLMELAAQMFLSEQQQDFVPPLPAPVPMYQRYGSYQGFPYIPPGGGGGHKISTASEPAGPVSQADHLRSSTQV